MKKILKRISLKGPFGGYGRAEVHLFLERDRVADSYLSIGFIRGFERILTGRKYTDVPFLASRICGRCFSTHQLASARAIENACRVEIPVAAELARNLMIASVFVSVHLSHFYLQVLPLFVSLRSALSYRGRDENLAALREKIRRHLEQGSGFAFFSAGSEDEFTVSDESQALDLISNSFRSLRIIKTAKDIGAFLGGRHPHFQSIIPGGVSFLPDGETLLKIKFLLDSVAEFVKKVFVPDVISLSLGSLLEKGQTGEGCEIDNFLSWSDFFKPDGTSVFTRGAVSSGKSLEISEEFFEKVSEDTSHSFLKEDAFAPEMPKKGAYSFCTAPRYRGMAFETGPLSRMLVSNESNLKRFMEDYGIKPGFVARNLARAFETARVVNSMYEWLDELMSLSTVPGARIKVKTLPMRKAHGVAITEAPSGTTLHAVSIENGFVRSYRIIGGSTWNASPHDGKNNPGPAEASLKGVKLTGETGNLGVRRILSSFELCPFCATH